MMLHAVLIAATLIADIKTNDLKVMQVNDRRGKFSGLTVTVIMPSVKLSEVAASRVILKSAVDDLGTNLIGSTQEPDLDQNTRRKFDKGGEPSPMIVSFDMKNPPRNAKTLKDVRGDIELYMPSRDANSVATVPKFMSQSGRSISDRALKANGIELTLISSDQFAATKKAALDKYRAEEKAKGLDGDDLEQAVKNYGEYEYLNPEENDVLAKLNDPSKRLQSITYVDAGGDEKPVRMSEKNGVTVLSTWAGKPAADWTMRINLKTPKTIVRVPLALTNVPLP
jgi:hypothetical protein